MKIGNKYAEEFGYTRYVGETCEKGSKEVLVDGYTLTEVKIKAKDIPFPLSILVHKEDITS